jgi:hypothetical protein
MAYLVKNASGEIVGRFKYLFEAGDEAHHVSTRSGKPAVVVHPDRRTQTTRRTPDGVWVISSDHFDNGEAC